RDAAGLAGATARDEVAPAIIRAPGCRLASAPAIRGPAPAPARSTGGHGIGAARPVLRGAHGPSVRQPATRYWPCDPDGGSVMVPISPFAVDRDAGLGVLSMESIRRDYTVVFHLSRSSSPFAACLLRRQYPCARCVAARSSRQSWA